MGYEIIVYRNDKQLFCVTNGSIAMEDFDESKIHDPEEVDELEQLLLEKFPVTENYSIKCFEFSCHRAEVWR